jgi:hypothetical protein
MYHSRIECPDSKSGIKNILGFRARDFQHSSLASGRILFSYCGADPNKAKKNGLSAPTAPAPRARHPAHHGGGQQGGGPPPPHSLYYPIKQSTPTPLPTCTQPLPYQAAHQAAHQGATPLTPHSPLLYASLHTPPAPLPTPYPSHSLPHSPLLLLYLPVPTPSPPPGPQQQPPRPRTKAGAAVEHGEGRTCVHAPRAV